MNNMSVFEGSSECYVSEKQICNVVWHPKSASDLGSPLSQEWRCVNQYDDFPRLRLKLIGLALNLSAII